LITLREIQLLIRDGWHGTRLQEFDEGYGHRTYLIPQDATHPLIAATRLALLQWCTVSYVLPRFLQDA
jgi:hypothetical protein